MHEYLPLVPLIVFIFGKMKKVLLSCGLLIYSLLIRAQTYTVNGSAFQIDCHTYRLTDNVGGQSGSVWNNFKIDLSQPFNFTFDVFLGTIDANGADGIAFVLQPISTSVGSSGSGLGFQGIVPSIGITLDTYQNSSPDNDPSYDHIAIQRNGDLNHNSANNLAGPVTIISGNNNVEDGLWHVLKINWDAASKKMDCFFDGVLRVSVVNDFVNTTFSGNPLVYWGFTGSTGGLANLQKFRTTLTPSFSFSPAQKRCIGETINFIDGTSSFAPVQGVVWDFGDGSPTSTATSPSHIYAAAGNYTVTQTVTGADGCVEVNTQIITIGSKPIANFTYSDSCVNNTINFFDASAVTVGSINNYYWDFDNGQTSLFMNPSTTYSTNGNKNIRLAVKTIEGCESDTLIQPIHIFSRPVVDFTFTDSVCLGSPTLFNGSITPVGGDTARAWNFIIDGQSFPNQLNPSYTFITPGNHTVTFTATATGQPDCLSTISKDVFVKAKPIAYFKNNAICEASATTITDSSYTTDGTAINGWWWDLGNGQFSNQQNPQVTYSTAGTKTIKLVVTAGSCISDTLTRTINVDAKPVAKFGYSTPLCSNTPVQFSDSSTVATGNIAQWNWINNGTSFSTNQNPSQTFSAGIQTVGLVVTGNTGCKSDTAFKTFAVNPKPDISMNFSNACRYSPVTFTATDINGVGIANWSWTFGDGIVGNGSSTQHTYNTNGTYNVTLSAVSAAGCLSDVKQGNIIIYSTNAFAGNDTIAAAGQPIQLNATGGVNYEWIPTTGLSNPFIANPVAIIFQTQQYVLKAFTPQGCTTYDTVLIKIYKGPDIYLPNAFTPNGDGLNDVLRGIPIGIKQFDYLRIYNRWGQLLFTTADYRIGWNGEWKGQKQEQGTYIVMARGIDFKGNIINKKGTVMLIR